MASWNYTVLEVKVVHVNKMAVMPIYGKNLQKSSELNGWSESSLGAQPEWLT